MISLRRFPALLLLSLGLALPALAAADGKPWQLNLSLAPTKGFLTLGRDIGLNYVGAGFQGIAYGTRDGWIVSPGVSYQRRFADGRLPYLGLSARATHEAERGWHSPTVIPALGYEWRWRPIYLHVEGYLATPLDAGFGKKRAFGAGVGVGVPF